MVSVLSDKNDFLKTCLQKNDTEIVQPAVDLLLTNKNGENLLHMAAKRNNIEGMSIAS